MPRQVDITRVRDDEFIPDPGGKYVGYFGIPAAQSPTNPASVERLQRLFGYTPADPENPEHRAMFPTCIVLDGRLCLPDGRVAMIGSKEEYDQAQKEKYAIDNRKVFGMRDNEEENVLTSKTAQEIPERATDEGVIGAAMINK